MSVLLETTVGDIVIDLYVNERKRCALNFLKLCKIKYYNYCLFFSVQRNYVAQTGDPTGTGRGGDSVFKNIYGDQAKYFDMEVKPKIKHTKKGLVSFVNNGNNQHGSQFFITLANNLDYLDGKHTVFGEISEGFDVLEKINDSICDDNDRPYQDIRLSHTIILDDPFDDPDGLDIPDRSPEPTKEQIQSDRIGAGEKINEFEGKTIKEMEEIIEDKDLQIGTQILQTIGDIPDADLKPPENVLFACKLNPVTTADDLEIIFSRFGQILSCEIIRDHKTGDSLCYGFIEFSKVEECEKAYFKMENVLIDDRRIHVDFCQSITKSKWIRSGLKGKYSFNTNGSQEKDTPAKLKPKMLEIKDKEGRDKYEMVFERDEERAGSKTSRRQDKYEGKEKYQKRDHQEHGYDKESKYRVGNRSSSDERHAKKEKKITRTRSESLEDDRRRRKEGSKKGEKDTARHRYSDSDSASDDERKRTLVRKERRPRDRRSSSDDVRRAVHHKRKKEHKKEKKRSYSSSSDDLHQAHKRKSSHGSKSRR